MPPLQTPMQAAQKAAALLLERQQAKEDFGAYIEYMHKYSTLSDFELLPAAHHKLINSELQRCSDTPRGKLTLSCPPGSAKSHYSSCLFPTWLLAKDPSHQVICASSGDALSGSFSRRRRAIMLSPEWEQLAGSKLDKNAKSLSYLGTIDAGGILAVSSGGSVVGRRCDVIIHDDIVSGFEMANSTVQMDKLWQWFLQDARTRLKPKGQEIVIMTRWVSTDPVGKAMEMSAAGLEQWRHVRLPLVADSKDDPLNRKIGARLWPGWYTPQFVEEAKRDDRNFRCLFQQRPVDERGRWCSEQHIHRVQQEDVPRDLRHVIAVDIALSLGKGDYSVFLHIGIDCDRTIYLINTYRSQSSPDQTAAKLVDWCAAIKPDRVLCDADNASKVWALVVQNEAKAQQVRVPLALRPTRSRDKEERAAAIRSHFLSDRIRLVEHTNLNDVVEEILSFPSAGCHDDAIDCFSLIGREYLRLGSPKASKAAPARPSGLGRGALMQRDGKIVVRSCLDDLFKDREKEMKQTLSIAKMRI